MDLKVYKGRIIQDDFGENYEALMIGEGSQPIAQIFKEDFVAKQVTIRYWTSKEEKTKQELQESVLGKLFGDVEAEYTDRYSELTGYLWTDQELNVGGHDVISELESFIGDYIYMEVEIHEA